MNCYICFIYDGILNTDRVQKMMMVSGTEDEAGKYVKKNVREFYDYFYIMAHNVKDTSDDRINELELAVKKAFWKHNYHTNRRAEKETVISELKHMLSEMADQDIMPNFYSYNRQIIADPNDQSPYKIIETHKFIKTLGNTSISYHLPNTFGV